MSGGDFVILIPENYHMTVKVKVKGEVVSTDPEKDSSINLVFAKPVYFYASGKSAPLFSIDGKHWDYGSKLFTGTITAGLAMEKDSTEKQPMVNLDLLMDVRK
jgi:hypothetical protein